MNKTLTQWQNWSGSVVAQPVSVRKPKDEAELAAIVRTARRVRATGAGHSFMPLCASDDVIVSLADMDGRLEVLPGRMRVRAPAGWSLKRLTAVLWQEGLSLANQGDVNPQSLAGALSTGTHGTGVTLGSLATLAHGFRLIDAAGEARWVTAETDADLFEAQRLSLGMFGIASAIEIAVVPAYHLAERIGKRAWSAVRETFMADAAAHRHLEFLVFPYADYVILKTLEPCGECPPPASTSDMEEAGFRKMLDIAAGSPSLIPTLQQAAMRGDYDSERQGPAYTIFPSDRTIPFEEMEYELPAAAGIACMDEIFAHIRRRELEVSFPFEFRLVAADDIWMSPMNAGPVASISMHQYARMRWQEVFGEIEPILRAAGGRPHWAKRHTLTREDVTRLYPKAEAYRAVRRRADPEGKFLNSHLEALFG